MTESMSVAQSVINEKQMKIEAMEQEKIVIAQTNATIINQKKDYVNKVMAQMESLRAAIEQRVSNERMIQEEIRTCARQNFETILLRNTEILGLRDRI